MTRPRTASRCTPAVVALLAGLAVAADRPAPPVCVRTPQGVCEFVLDRTDAPRANATLHSGGASHKGGPSAQSEPGYALESRVIVRSASAPRLNRPGCTVRAHPARGFWVVRTPTVADAIDLADELAERPGVLEAYVDVQRPITLRDVPSDPGLSFQWHLRNLIDPAFDANVDPSWADDYTGLGVVIGIVDSANFQKTHPDLQANYLAEASIVQQGINPHATSVAGVAGAVGNNGQGGVGVAFEAQIATLPIGTASTNATSLAHRNDINDVKNCSWGPSDNAKVHPISSVELQAIVDGVTTGRAGLGEVFVWAAGNGGDNSDRVDYDQWAASRYTIAIGGIDDDDDSAYYNERGSSMLAVAHSSGRAGNRGIYTTDLVGGPGSDPGDYTDSFGGTSAASPLAAGVVALMLHANPDLTWRDVQHVLIRSVRKNDPGDETWELNGAGHDVHYHYGFGAIDADAAVDLALAWNNVGPESVLDSGVIAVNEALPDGDASGLTRTFTFDGDLDVESVELIISATGGYIGDLDIRLTSPMGTQSILAETRPQDNTPALVNFAFTSLRNWDESARGTWSVTISDRAQDDVHTWQDFRIKVYGTQSPGCAADLTGSSNPAEGTYGAPDGDIDADDLFYFLDRFAEGSLAVADLSGACDPNDPMYGVPDGALGMADFCYFLDLFTRGCP